MRTIITLLLVLGFAEASMAQGLVSEKQVVFESIEEMANSLYNPNGDNELLIIQMKKQISKAVDAHPTKSVDEIIEDMIKETQKENMGHAIRAQVSHAKLSTCEEALGEEQTPGSFYAEKYIEDGADDIQESLSGKAKQATAEVFTQASMIGKYKKFVLKYGTCAEKLKKKLNKSNELEKCQDKLENSEYGTGYGSIPYSPSNLGMSLGSGSGGFGY